MHTNSYMFYPDQRYVIGDRGTDRELFHSSGRSPYDRQLKIRNALFRSASRDLALCDILLKPVTR